MTNNDLGGKMKKDTCFSEEKRFTENDFVKLLFWLLIKNGVYQVSESDLKKKLYYYFVNPEFAEIFQDIHKNPLKDEVDISEGLNQEKYFRGNVVWSSKCKDILYLMYPMNMDLTVYDKKLSENGLFLMQRLAYEFALRYNIESRSDTALHIYGTNPNRCYSLFSGTCMGSETSLELLSDGVVQYKNFLNKDLTLEKTKLQDALMADVFLENASFAILREIYDGVIQSANVYTNILSEQELRKIRRFANTVYESNEHLALKGEPFVRKLELK